MAKEMLINTVAGRECRIAIVIGGVLEELYVERTGSASHVGNIYKGRVVNIEPSIQAAFVDFGLPKHGFLHISDLHPQYFPDGKKTVVEDVGKKRPHYRRPPIQECLKRGQEVIVQMTKEGIGSKGPTMTTYLSIPGRLLVMMPGMARLGVSRKVEDEETRQQARQALGKLKLPGDLGFIVRTAGVGKSKRDLERDLNYLLRLWKTVKRHTSSARAPAEVYEESDLLIRTIRDVHNKDIDRIICDDEQTARRVMEFLQVVAPRTSHHIELYSGKEGLFHDYGLDQEIERIYAPRVELKSGGSLVIEQAEALVAIDVNSGRFRDHSDAETTALKMNQEAAREIARQLRLRDLGGVIVIDFIDMREGKNRAAVERTLRDAIKDDRAKSKVLRMSAFGIVEMTRQRLGPSLRASMYRTCDNCRGTGLIKSEESQALQVMRCLQRAAAHDEVARIELSVTPAVAHNLANQQRKQLADLESRSGKSVIVMASPDLAGDEMTITCTNSRGSIVAWETNPLEGQGKKVVQTVSFEEMEARRARDKQQTQQPPQAVPGGAPGGAPAGEAEGKAKEPQAKRPAAQPAEPAGPPQAEGIKAKKSRRRGKRGGRKHHKADNASPEAATPEAQPPDKADKPAPQEAPPPRDNAAKAPPEPQPSRDKRPRPAPGRSREPAQAKSQRDKADQKPQPGADEKPQAPTEAGKAEDHAQPAEGDSPDAKDKKKRRRGKRGGRKHKKKGAAKDNG